MTITLVALALVLTAASVGISVLNWASMPSTDIGMYVAIAIALGLEGSKLYLVPYARYIWREDRLIAWSSLLMGSIMTVISVGGIVLWLDKNLEFNAAVKADVAQVDAIRQARIDLAVVLVAADKASKADRVLDKVVSAKDNRAETPPTGLILPFTMSENQRWLLLTAIAVTIDLGALLLVTILVSCRPKRKKDKRDEFTKQLDEIKTKAYDVEYPSLKWSQEGHPGLAVGSLPGDPGMTGVVTHKCPDGYRMTSKVAGTYKDYIDQRWCWDDLKASEFVEKIPMEPIRRPVALGPSAGISLKPREIELRDVILDESFGKVLPSRNKISKEFGIRPSSVKRVIDGLLVAGKLEETNEGLKVCE